MLEQFLEILKYTLPSLIVLISVYLIIKQFVGQSLAKHRIEAFSDNQKLLTPLRLQAYERVILLLERITIEALALRLQVPGMSARQLQILMLENIRKEFNHNLSQQLYVSEKSWSAVKNCKEQIIRIINVAGTQMKTDSKASDLTRLAMQLYSENQSMLIEHSIEIIKKEASATFGM